jgi:hypothetical protein
MQRYYADVNSPHKQKCWTHSGGPLVISLFWTRVKAWSPRIYVFGALLHNGGSGNACVRKRNLANPTNVPYNYLFSCANGSMIKRCNVFVMFWIILVFLWRKSSSNSVVMCLCFRIHRYLAAPCLACVLRMVHRRNRWWLPRSTSCLSRWEKMYRVKSCTVYGVQSCTSAHETSLWHGSSVRIVTIVCCIFLLTGWRKSHQMLIPSCLILGMVWVCNWVFV